MVFTVEVESSVSASRMFKAAVLDWHNLAPKVAPEIIISGVGLEGEGAVGSIRQLNFSSVLPFSFVKERLDFVDHDKFEVKSTLIEGGLLTTTLDSASMHFKIDPTSSGGSLCKAALDFKPKPGVDAGDEATKGNEHLAQVFKKVEAFLVANPDAYV
uniref:Pathogenesis-related protein 10 n=1 Tax=Lilium regale TaxID=82328 RepID=A0A1Z1W233_LILRE|nr:pathogenesis-related protein 10 [Lilium regale]